MWANIHPDFMKAVLKDSLASPSEADMQEAFMVLENITIKFRRTTNLVLRIHEENLDIFQDSVA